MNVLKYGDITVNVSDIPETSQMVLMQRGLSHILGNEASSKVKALYDAAFANTTEGQPVDFDRAAELENVRNDLLGRIISGDIAVRATGPRGTALETVMRAIAGERIVANAKKSNVTLPTGKKTINVGGTPMTRAEIVAAHLAKYESVIRELAEERMAQNEAATDDMADLIG